MTRFSWEGRTRQGASVRGEMPPQLPLPMPWVTAEDCAFVCIEALEQGVTGERYIAHGVAGEGGLEVDCRHHHPLRAPRRP